MKIVTQRKDSVFFELRCENKVEMMIFLFNQKKMGKSDCNSIFMCNFVAV